MPQFAPDQVTFKDDVAYGYWDDNHHREHQQFVQVLSGLTVPVVIPNYDFLQMLTAGNVRKQIIESHQSAHELLRQYTGVSGTDYTEFKFDNEQDFYNFLGWHATEHAAIRTALGIV